MTDVPFHVCVEAYLEDGTRIYVESVQAMYYGGNDRIILAYYTHQDKEITSKICMTVSDTGDIPIYVTDPRPYMTPAGEVLYG